MFITFNERHYLTEAADPTDSWDRDSYGLDLRVTGVQVSEPSSADTEYKRIDLDAKPGDEVHAVVVRYTDGDTFGHDGHWEDLLVTKDPLEAHNAAQHAEGKVHPTEGFYPWLGYFGSLDSVEIQTFTLGF